jgi:hypothetical protein
MYNENGLRRFKAPEILEFAVSKLSDRDMQSIIELNYTGPDKLKLLLKELNTVSASAQLSEEELLSSLVDSYRDRLLKQGPKALPKSIRALTEEKICS